MTKQKCSTCKKQLPIIDFALKKNGNRYLSCTVCIDKYKGGIGREKYTQGFFLDYLAKHQLSLADTCDQKLNKDTVISLYCRTVGCKSVLTGSLADLYRKEIFYCKDCLENSNSDYIVDRIITMLVDEGYSHRNITNSMEKKYKSIVVMEKTDKIQIHALPIGEYTHEIMLDLEKTATTNGFKFRMIIHDRGELYTRQQF